MEYPQAKLRLFAQTNSHFEVPMTTESNPEAKADVKEMEEWAARQKERADRVASTPQATKPRISKPRSSEPVRDLGPPVVRGPEERPPSGDPLLQPSEKGHAPVKLNRAAMQVSVCHRHFLKVSCLVENRLFCSTLLHCVCVCVCVCV